MKLIWLLLLLAGSVPELYARSLSEEADEGGNVANTAFFGRPTCSRVIRRNCNCPSGTNERPVRTTKLPSGEIYCLRLPRLLSNPELAKDNSSTFVRTWNDTCGLYTVMLSPFIPEGEGPPPHIHFQEDEWWFTSGPNERFRLHAQRAGSALKQLRPGEIPSVTPDLAPVDVGGAEVSVDSIGYSPIAVPHAFKGATDLTNFWSIFGYGRTISQVVNAVFDQGTNTRDQVLAETGLWGCPHDVSSAMFGGPGFVNNRGPLAIPAVKWADLVRLQSLFDRGEACYPSVGRR